MTVEPWEKRHRELYGDDGKPTAEFYRVPDHPGFPPPNPFAPIRVTDQADEYIAALEQAAMGLATAEGREETEDAYSVLCMARKALYKYVEGLERRAKKNRTVSKRF